MLNGQIVYIAHTGSKFHNPSCRTLAKGKTAIELSNALADGYVACKICKPSQTIGSTKKSEIIRSSNQKESEENNSTTTQCSAKTKAGNRCTRKTKSSNGKCYQHGGK